MAELRQRTNKDTAEVWFGLANHLLVLLNARTTLIDKLSSVGFCTGRRQEQEKDRAVSLLFHSLLSASWWSRKRKLQLTFSELTLTLLISGNQTGVS